MLIRLETTSNHVQGISFHSRRPWILAGLLRGGIELWDYRMEMLIHRFDEHEGPVQSVSFHQTSGHLFVSGGDDSTVKVWNCDTRKCLYTLLGHLGIIRTVQFHHTHPWIMSASDDKTVRIWNLQTRSCISELIGHHGSVMSALFHPEKDMLVSASLDRTLRVWDFGGFNMHDPTLKVKLKHVLRGHKEGVKSVSFHPCLDLIVSAAKDGVRLWRLNETVQSQKLKGDAFDVLSVVFCAKRNLIVSTYDKSIRFWDIAGKAQLQTPPRKHDQFWTVAVHPKLDLLAAGHDRGMIVFKLDRERPAFSVYCGSLFYIMGGSLLQYDFHTRLRSYIRPLLTTRGEYRSVKALSYSPTKNVILTFHEKGHPYDNSYYELNSTRYYSPWLAGPEDIRYKEKMGGSISVLMVSNTKFVVLKKGTRHMEVKNFSNETVREVSLPFPTYAIFNGGYRRLVCSSEDRVVIFDVFEERVLGELETPSVIRFVVWSSDMKRVALVSKHKIIIASKTLLLQCTLEETRRVKSGAWDEENGVFIYTTLNHLKFWIPNGDGGIIKTLDDPMYVTNVYRNTAFCLNRKEEVRLITIVEDEKIRFNLAIETGNITVAYESAKMIKERDHWNRLGMQALRQGNCGIAEDAYQQSNNSQGLSFLYLITGKLEKLTGLMTIAECENNVMGQFHNALYLGDVKERVKILENAGHLPLAYITASVHGLNDIAERLKTELGDKVPSLPQGLTPLLLMPPMPVIRGGDNWPTTNTDSSSREEPLTPPSPDN